MKLKPLLRPVTIMSLLLIGPSASAANEPLGLVEAVQIALEGNNDLLSKKAQLDADSEAANQSWGSILPNVTFRYTSGYSEYDTEILNQRDSRDDSFNRATLSVVQPIYAPKRFRDIERSEQMVTTKTIQFELDQQIKSLEVIESYLDLLKYNHALELSQEELEAHKSVLKRLDSMLKRGLSTKMDTLEAYSRRDQLKANVISNRNEVILRIKRLETLLGRPVDKISSIDIDLWKRTEQILSKKTSYNKVLSNTPIVQVAENNYKEARLAVDVQKADYLPEINLRAEATDTDSYETIIRDERKIQLELIFPLYQGGTTDSKVNAAQKVKLSRQYFLAERKRLVRVELEDTLSQLNNGQANIIALQQSVISSQSYLDAAEKGLQYGLRSQYEVLDAKSKVYSAKQKLSSEIYNNLNNQFRLLFLVGKLNAKNLSNYLISSQLLDEIK